MPNFLKDRLPLLVAAVFLLALPFIMRAIGLGTTSATEVVIFAIACMALNILVGWTGLVSFGHGAWFGLAAYAAGLIQRELLPGISSCPCSWRWRWSRSSRSRSARSSCAGRASIFRF